MSDYLQRPTTRQPSDLRVIFWIAGAGLLITFLIGSVLYAVSLPPKKTVRVTTRHITPAAEVKPEVDPNAPIRQARLNIPIDWRRFEDQGIPIWEWPQDEPAGDSLEPGTPVEVIDGRIRLGQPWTKVRTEDGNTGWTWRQYVPTDDEVGRGVERNGILKNTTDIDSDYTPLWLKPGSSEPATHGYRDREVEAIGAMTIDGRQWSEIRMVFGDTYWTWTEYVR